MFGAKEAQSIGRLGLRYVAYVKGVA